MDRHRKNSNFLSFGIFYFNVTILVDLVDMQSYIHKA